MTTNDSPGVGTKREEFDREEFFVSQPPDRDELRQCYYRVDPSGPCEVWPDGDDEPMKVSMYDVWMEDRNGFGLKSVLRSDTPWSNRAIAQEGLEE